METEIYSRVVGYYRPIKNFNPGQLKQFWDRKYFMEGGRFC
jgi:ribonucleoside-triphosphate reductase